jgi:hypothetical protein
VDKYINAARSLIERNPNLSTEAKRELLKNAENLDKEEYKKESILKLIKEEISPIIEKHIEQLTPEFLLLYQVAIQEAIEEKYIIKSLKVIKV